MSNPYPHFLQTPAWGKAKSLASPGWSWYFFVNYKDSPEFTAAQRLSSLSRLKVSVLILERKLGLGQYLHYIPRGPYINWKDSDSVKKTLTFLKSFATQRKVLFLRIEPNAFKQDFNYQLMFSLGFKKTDDFIQVPDTVKVNIAKSDEELLSSFHRKCRYNIKLAQRRGLTVRSSTKEQDVIIFYNLLQKTEQRHGGVLNIHPLAYYKSLVRELSKNNMACIYLVEKEKKAISASLVFTYGDEAIYVFGASDYRYRRDMPNHLREWQSIRDARDQGKHYFDLWGVTMRRDPGGGIKRYKLGYNTEILKMAGTFDWAPHKFKYRLFNVLNKIRRRI